jgi:hypothetical protein
MDELLYRMLDMGVGTQNPESTQEVEGAEGGDGDSTSQNKADDFVFPQTRYISVIVSNNFYGFIR